MNPPAIWETSVRSLGWEDPLEEGMANHSSILAWRMPMTEEPGGLQSMGLQRVRHDWATKHSTAYMYAAAAAAAAKSLQSCPTLCNPPDGSPAGSPVPGILKARTLEWVAIFFSNAWKWKLKVKSLSPVWLFPTTWTAAHQAPPSMGFPRQEYWSGLPLPSLAYMYTYTYILFLFHDGLLKDAEYNSLCYTSGPCCLSILYITVCIQLMRFNTKSYTLKVLCVH